jgi:Cysteine-rich secretory protein family
VRRKAGNSLLGKTLLRVCVAVYALLALAAAAVAQNAVDTAGAQQLLSLINQERAKESVSALTANDQLSQAALKHSQKMAAADSIQHQLEGEEPLALRLGDENVRSDRDGENIALDNAVASAHVMLMQSPLHRANILNPQFNAVGIGVVRNGDLVYVTEDFAHVFPTYSELEADAATQQAINDYVRAQRFPLPTRKPRTQLTHLACDMALEDKLEGEKARQIPGVTSAVAWTATDLTKLPNSLKKILSQPLSSDYSLGVCFAPSVSHPGGIYWVVMVIY